jgi:hypothetical protein
MAYTALSAFLDAPHPPTILDQARRLVHFDFDKAGIYCTSADVTMSEAQDKAALLIAKLIEQEIERAAK